MQLKEIMTSRVEVVDPESTLDQAASKMSQEDVGMIPVIEKDQPVGVITDRDIAVRAVAQHKDPATTKVRDVMTHEIVYCFDDQDIEEAAKLMEERQVRRLMVLDRGHRLVGVVSLGDLARQPGTQPKAGEVLNEVSQPSNQPRQGPSPRGRRHGRTAQKRTQDPGGA